VQVFGERFLRICRAESGLLSISDSAFWSWDCGFEQFVIIIEKRRKRGNLKVIFIALKGKIKGDKSREKFGELTIKDIEKERMFDLANIISCLKNN
jgi:hypothetical protein